MLRKTGHNSRRKEFFAKAKIIIETMKNVLITGASGGIGKAAALAFAERGYGVALHYHTGETAAKETAEQIRKVRGAAEIFCADLTKEAEVDELFRQVQEQLGFVSTLVNNAGADWKGLLTDMTLREWENLFAVNCTGIFLCCRRALPPMVREHTGSIVNVSSIWGEVGASCEAAYSASKAAVIGLTKALAKEVGPAGIRVNCVSPGVIDTPMNGDLSAEDLSVLKEETPLMRIGTPEETAEAIVFLAEHPFITGQVLGVNGGFAL